MKYIPRILNLRKLVKKKSLFLFGPRQTGKSSLIRNELKEARVFNLLDQDTFLNLSQQPSRMRGELQNKDKIVVIDEIQKLPELLDEVHLLIEEKGMHFVLTGSSPRAIRRKGINLLGGRADSWQLHPFVFSELPSLNLNRVLSHGLLPPIYASASPERDLRAYCGDYLQNEILAEGLTRNLPAFSRFLEVAALSQARLINFTEIANDSQVKLATVREYFQILKDTLIAHELPAFGKTKNRKAIQTAKYYFFDVGVARALQGRTSLSLKTPEAGEAFETYLFHELRTYCDYHDKGPLQYWRSTSDYEVDFILNERVGIEVKAKSNITSSDLKGIRAFQEEKITKRHLVVCLEKTPRKVDAIEILPWEHFLTMLWEGGFD